MTLEVGGASVWVLNDIPYGKDTMARRKAADGEGEATGKEKVPTEYLVLRGLPQDQAVDTYQVIGIVKALSRKAAIEQQVAAVEDDLDHSSGVRYVAVAKSNFHESVVKVETTRRIVAS